MIGLVERLAEREAEVIRCRYGLVPGAAQTYDEIAGRLGVSRERARQIEREALEHLRDWVADTARSGPVVLHPPRVRGAAHRHQRPVVRAGSIAGPSTGQ